MSHITTKKQENTDMKRQTFDPEKFQLDIAKIRKHGEQFEVVVDADAAILFREGSEKNIVNVLKSEHIFSDAQKGLLATELSFVKAFNTSDKNEIAKIILEKGEIQITAEKRKAEIEKKKRRIITMLQRYGVDPRTNVPHTIVRIEDAVAQSKVHIDEFKPVETQVKEIIKKIQIILPIRFETKSVRIDVPTKSAHAVYSYIQKMGVISKQVWGADQSWSGTVEIPGGLEQEFYDKLNSLSHGTVTTEIVEINKSKL
jgi:ribosome maturation protein SDO1